MTIEVKTRDEWPAWPTDVDKEPKRDHAFVAPVISKIWALSPKPKSIQELAEFDEGDVKKLGEMRRS